jgi:prostaglandin-H2 D-isomerase / glutathione transferase
MAQYKLTYFDFSASRGEDCRLALFVAGVPFVDNRIGREAWAELKAKVPFGAIPLLETEGKPPLAQSNAILSYVGRKYGLLPADAWEAARHEAILESVEEVRAALAPSGKLTDPAEKKAAREAFASGFLQTWGAQMEKQIVGPFIGGAAISVADIKVYQIVHSFKSGTIDYVSPSVLGAFAKLSGVYDAVLAHPLVKEWQGRPHAAK